MTDEVQTAEPSGSEQAVDSIYGLFGTDKEMERSGIWLDYGKFGSFLIARAGGSNDRFQKAMERLSRPHRKQIANETLDDDIANDLLLKAFAEAVVLSWKGIKDKDGREMPFTRDNVIKLFKDLPDLFVDVREQAQKSANYRSEEVETDLGNS